jgi:hypothetical protein
MTTRKPALPALKPTAIAIAIGAKVGGKLTATAVINEDCQWLYKALKKSKQTVGTLKSDCVIMAAFISGLTEGNAFSEQTIKNEATAFRRACNEGVPYSKNGYRAKGAKSTKSGEAKPVVTLTIVKDSDINDVAQGLREALEKRREQYADLVAFIIDAIDEFEGK